MKRLLGIFLLGFILFVTSCSEDNMKQHYDVINEHNGCIVTLGKDYKINRLDHYYLFDNYNLEEYDYICFAINADDMDNITVDDLIRVRSILNVVPTFAMLYLQNFDNYSALEGSLFTSTEVAYYNANITLMLTIGFSNGQGLFNKPGDTNVKDFKTNLVRKFAWEINLYEGQM